MGKLRVLSGREVCRILETQGFTAVRQRGSHIVMQKRFEGTTTTVPVPDHDELKAGTLSSISRPSGLPRSSFYAAAPAPCGSTWRVARRDVAAARIVRATGWLEDAGRLLAQPPDTFVEAIKDRDLAIF